MSDNKENSQNLLVDNDEELDALTSSSAGVKRIKRNEDDDDTNNKEYMLAKFPFHSMNSMVRKKFKPNGEDPRGWDHPYGSDLPSGYCIHCKCMEALCHDKRFGLYCGLRVAELVEKKGACKMFGDDVKDLLKVACNKILCIEIVQQVGVLDTHNNYIPPKCMEDRSMKNIMNHFFYMKFTTAMNKRLEDGSKGKYGTGSFGFYTALKEQDEKENGK